MHIYSFVHLTNRWYINFNLLSTHVSHIIHADNTFFVHIPNVLSIHIRIDPIGINEESLNPHRKRIAKKGIILYNRRVQLFQQTREMKKENTAR